MIAMGSKGGISGALLEVFGNIEVALRLKGNDVKVGDFIPQCTEPEILHEDAVDSTPFG